MLARILGATPIIALDISGSILARARHFGADEVINVLEHDPIQAIKSFTGGKGVDVAIECVGSGKTVRWAAESVVIGGRVVVIGLSPEPVHLMEITQFVRKEVTLMGSSAFEIKEINQLINLVASGRLDLSHSVTETLTLDQVNDGLDRLAQNPGNIIRLVVNAF
jgi:threonine dehydrogenase-like Zn-dependent dehydrogenase